VIFAPPVQGSWLRHVLDLAQTLPTRPKVVIAMDGALHRPKRGRLASFLTQKESPELAQTKDLPALYDILTRHGCEVVVLHKKSGNLIGAAQINAWRQSA